MSPLSRAGRIKTPPISTPIAGKRACGTFKGRAPAVAETSSDGRDMHAPIGFDEAALAHLEGIVIAHAGYRPDLPRDLNLSRQHV